MAGVLHTRASIDFCSKHFMHGSFAAKHARAEACLQVHIGQMSFPLVHETLAAARSRFQSSLLQLQSEYSGTVLVVTHGDALGAVIEQVPPLPAYLCYPCCLKHTIGGSVGYM
jgi:broad specificity phosphatase PhoE